MRKYMGEIGLLVTAIIWGTGFPVSAISLDYFSPYQILAGRFVIGAVLLGVVFYKKLLKLSTAVLLKGGLLGVFLYGAFAFQTVGLQYTTPSNNAFLTAVNVLIVPFIAFVLYRRRVSPFEIAGAILAMTGIALLSLNGSLTVNPGDVLSLLCAVFFAFHIFYTGQFVRKEDAISLTLVQMTVAAVIAWIVIGVKGEASLPITTTSATSLLYLGVFSTTLAFLLQTVAQKHVSETKAAILLSMESLWGMIFSIIMLREIVTGQMIIGAALILLAILLAETKPSFLMKRKIRKSIL
ncbi:DMT family transporter [Sporosarcina gallistercoris]|uniref:DMT family transporter n=1 Tax=Sporosarcina gallistercoris TaxID=2762245 RepID=A0ABR8PH17_9BACL|nr:DMT family transporter [Sporosarcina gallistercoris]MBD7907461.1 DMT family transporter [Sporosarcina gallistercoris]